MIEQQVKDDYRQAIAAWERLAQETFSELGVVGDKCGEQVYMEEGA